MGLQESYQTDLEGLMSDSRRRYDAVRRQFEQLVPDLWEEASYWMTNLSLLVSAAVVAEELTQSALAAEMPLAVQDTSLAQRQRRWLLSEQLTREQVYPPIVQPFVNAMSRTTLPLILDSTAAGANSHLLTLSLAYQQRAVPLVWDAGHGRRGHTTATRQQALLEQAATLCPDHSDVLVLGDGEFSSSPLVRWLEQQGWSYALRCACDTCIWYEGAWRRLDSFDLLPGETRWFEGVRYTQAAALGPVNILLTYDSSNDRLLPIVTNLPIADEVVYWYRKRFWTEPFYGDVKGHGFDLQACRLRHPARLARLMLVVALAYLWSLFLGSVARLTGQAKWVDRTDRRDRSLFSLGRQWLKWLLKNDRTLPVRFRPWLGPPLSSTTSRVRGV